MKGEKVEKRTWFQSKVERELLRGKNTLYLFCSYMFFIVFFAGAVVSVEHR